MSPASLTRHLLPVPVTNHTRVQPHTTQNHAHSMEGRVGLRFISVSLLGLLAKKKISAVGLTQMRNAHLSSSQIWPCVSALSLSLVCGVTPVDTVMRLLSLALFDSDVDHRCSRPEVIFDPSRTIRLKLYDTEAEFEMNNNAAWNRLFAGRWKVFSGKAVVREELKTLEKIQNLEKFSAKITCLPGGPPCPQHDALQSEKSEIIVLITGYRDALCGDCGSHSSRYTQGCFP